MWFQLYANLICVHREVSGFIQIAELIVFPALLGLWMIIIFFSLLNNNDF